MRTQLRICRGRGVAVVLASGAAISLTALTGGMVPALADPVTETTATTTAATAPSTAVIPRQTVSDIPSATVQAPPTTQAPLVTRESQVVTTTAAAPIPTP